MSAERARTRTSAPRQVRRSSMPRASLLALDAAFGPEIGRGFEPVGTALPDAALFRTMRALEQAAGLLQTLLPARQWVISLPPGQEAVELLARLGGQRESVPLSEGGVEERCRLPLPGADYVAFWTRIPDSHKEQVDAILL